MDTLTLRSMTPNQFILLTIEDDTEEAPWIMMGDPQMRAVSALYNALSYYLQQTRPDGPGAGNAGWYVASMLPIHFPRPRTTHATGQLGPDLFVAHAEDRPRQSYDMTAGEPPPAFVLEVLSPESVTRDLELKRGAYDELGVQEYALFAPTPNLGQPALQGFRREVRGEEFVPWEIREGRLYSEVLGLWFVPQGPLLRARQQDGSWLPTYAEARDREAEARQQLEAEIARLRAELQRRPG